MRHFRLAVPLFALCAFGQKPFVEPVRVPDAPRAEAELKDHPDDVVLRTGLIARYYNQAFEAEAAAAQQHRSEHILWLAEHRPEAPVLGQQEGFIGHTFDREGSDSDNRALEAVWRKQIQGDSVPAAVLANAGYFFRTADRELAAGLLQRAIRMDPKEAGYSETLGHVYANAALGVTQERYGDAATRVDAKLAQSAFAKRALAILDESTDVPMLRRAGFLFTMSGTLARGPLGSKLDFVPDAFAEKLLLRARYLAPDAETLAELCQHYRLRALREKDSAAKAHLSWQELDVLRERQGLATNEYQHSSLLVEQARAAYGARDPKSAGEFARQLLTWAGQHPESSGDAIHQANTILGLVAVDSGDLESAAQFLIASAKMSGSPVLGSFGPSMRLAQALLQVGKPEPVLEYFRLCTAFWDMGKDQLEQWTKAVHAGQMPAFEASLIH